MPTLLSEVVNALVERVAPEFCRYTQIDNLACAALEPEAKSRLLMNHINVATVLALAGKRQQFWAWREAYRNGFVGNPAKPFWRPEARQFAEHYMSALEQRLLRADSN
jgi:hypothetical protein